MEIHSHDRHDWCHICGQREVAQADVFYPANAEHGDQKNTEYIRICIDCAEQIYDGCFADAEPPTERMESFNK